ncbi:hypothetical protein Godav_016273 [Gossypium davidsonii]|uniref:F-box domain-containing protein n=1 Tax=Gossypium davidsonii TaxID=34287 RepID=A0A7J8RQT8_GOSDV|nr:hypothetical protein [Gossypium davidsonii]
MVSHALRSVADCDAVWEKFLPSDYKSIISGSSSSSLLSPGKRRIYIFISVSIPFSFKMSFQLKKESGKKCYMLGARALSVIWGDTPSTWKSLPESRFSEVAELKLVWWLEVKGMIDIRILSYNTNYAAYLVFKLRNKRTIEFRHRAVGLHINVGGITSWEVRRVSLDPSQNGTQHVREREDGWMEFFNEFGDDGTVQLCLREIDTSYYKQGLIIEGIELRPKDTGS